jgi:ABC-type glutathione transport system ATPase component
MSLRGRNLIKRFKEGRVLAVDGVSFSVGRGETLGIVGESGSGKSTLAKLATGLLVPDSGSVSFDEREVSGVPEKRRALFRKKVQIVFQEPYASLDPRMRISDILKEPFLIQGNRDKRFLNEKAGELLLWVGLEPRFLDRYPRELSGGECQRVAIARAFSTEPEIIVCDEPVSSLDALIQIQILNLLLRIQREKGTGYLFISHDLRVVHHMSDRVMVLKDGRVCEEGHREDVFTRPKDPYTRLLLSNLP